MDKAVVTEGLHYKRRQLRRETDPIARDVLSYHIKLAEQKLEKTP